MYKLLIAGGGISGLATAYRMVQNGCSDILLIEKEDDVGGLSKSVKFGGSTFDLGPHQIHTEEQKVIDVLKEILKNDLIIKRKKASLWFYGKYLNYPLGINDLLFGLPLNLSVPCFIDFCKQAILNVFKKRNHKEASFETWVISHFGKKMYEMYFGPYTQKVWGKHPSQLSYVCAKERIAVQNLLDILIGAVSKKLKRFRDHYHLPHSPYQKIFYYPKYGIGQLSKLMLGSVISGGGKILLNTEIIKIAKKDSHYSVYDDKDREHLAENVVSTIPITLLYDMLETDGLTKHHAHLEFRSLALLFFELNIDKVTDNHWIYFPDKDCLFQRASEFKNFSKDMCSADKCGVCIEIPCDYQDEIWNMDDKELFDRVILKSEEEGYIRREWVNSYQVKREKHAYPTYGLDYEDDLRIMTNHVGHFEGLYTIGRQGLFKYINIDEVMMMGFDVADKISNK